MTARLCLCLLLFFSALRTDAFEIEALDPSSLRGGEENVVTFSGKGFINDQHRLWTNFAGDRLLTQTLRLGTNSPRFLVPVPASANAEVAGLRLISQHDIGPLQFLVIDPFPLAPDTAGATPREAQAVKLPSAIQGKTVRLASKFYSLSLAKGQSITVEVFAQRVGANLDAVLSLRDPHGREVAFNDDRSETGADPGFRFEAMTTGVHHLELHDVAYREAASYHLRMGDFPLTSVSFPAQKIPESPLELPVTLSGRFIEPDSSHDHFFESAEGRWITIKPSTRSLGSPAFSLLTLFGPDGKRLAQSGAGDEMEEVLVHRLPHNGRYRLNVQELTNASSPHHYYQIRIDDSLGPFRFHLHNDDDALPEALLAVPGSRMPLKVRLHGPEDAGEVRIEATIDGNSCETFPSKLKPSDDPLDLRVKFPVKLAEGSLARLEVFAVSEIDGFHYRTPLSLDPLIKKLLPDLRSAPSWISNAAHHIGIIAPPFSIDVPNSQLAVTPGKTTAIDVSLQWNRPNEGSLIRDVSLQMVNKPNGVTAEPVEIQLGQEEATIHLNVTEEAEVIAAHDLALQPTFLLRGQQILLPTIPLRMEPKSE